MPLPMISLMSLKETGKQCSLKYSFVPGLSKHISNWESVLRCFALMTVSQSVVQGCFQLCQRFREFRLEFNWKGPFRFLLTGIFGIASGGGPHISVGIFRSKFTVAFLTNQLFALIREFGKRIQNDKSHFY